MYGDHVHGIIVGGVCFLNSQGASGFPLGTISFQSSGFWAVAVSCTFTVLHDRVRVFLTFYFIRS